MLDVKKYTTRQSFKKDFRKWLQDNLDKTFTVYDNEYKFINYILSYHPKKNYLEFDIHSYQIRMNPYNKKACEILMHYQFQNEEITKPVSWLSSVDNMTFNFKNTLPDKKNKDNVKKILNKTKGEFITKVKNLKDIQIEKILNEICEDYQEVGNGGRYNATINGFYVIVNSNKHTYSYLMNQDIEGKNLNIFELLRLKKGDQYVKDVIENFYIEHFDVKGKKINTKALDLHYSNSKYLQRQLSDSLKQILSYYYPIKQDYLNFGKYKGNKIDDILEKDLGYIEYIINQNYNVDNFILIKQKYNQYMENNKPVSSSNLADDGLPFR